MSKPAPRSIHHGLPRRAFLSGALAASATVGLPWLELFNRRVRAQDPMPPKRFVIFSAGHGPQAMIDSGGTDWIPVSTGPITALPTLLEPLAPYADRLTTVKGVDNIIRDEMNGDNHICASMVLLTAQPHQEAVSGNTITSAEITYAASNAAGPSIEYVMANGLVQRPLTLRIGVEEAQSRRTFDLGLNEDPGESDPMRAFNRLFTSMPGMSMATPADRLRGRRADLLATVQASYRGLAGRVGSADRLRLQAHADLIRDFQSQLDQTVMVTCTNPSIPASGVSDFESWDGPQDDSVTATQNSLITTALACQAVQVVSVNFATFSENTFPFLNGGAPMPFPNGWHECVHGNGSDDMRRVPMQWYFSIVTDLLRKLEAVPEGTGTLLDNTIVLWTSSLADQFHSTHDVPIVIASGPASGIARGHFDLGGAPRTMADFWTTMLNVMGVPATDFGWNPSGTSPTGRRYCTGPIASILG